MKQTVCDKCKVTSEAIRPVKQYMEEVRARVGIADIAVLDLCPECVKAWTEHVKRFTA